MKFFMSLVLSFVSLSVFAQLGDFDPKKLDAKTIKEKGCPMVNGKKDCTTEEVKTKVLDLKKKMKF